MYVFQDANWNVTVIATSSGSINRRFTYDPYGVATERDSGWNPTSGSGWVYLHQGGRLDGATELYAFRNRDFSPTLFRWVREDPLQFDAFDVNFFHYDHNNPTSQLDFLGLDGLSAARGGTVPPSNEAECGAVLRSVISDWRKQNWHFPANLLTHYLSNTGVPYVPTGADIQEVLCNPDARMILRFLLTDVEVDAGEPHSFATNGHQSIWDTLALEVNVSHSTYMFYTYGGFDYQLKGEASQITTKNGKCYATMDVDVKLSDTVDFPPDFPRLVFPSYNRAWQLQNYHKYKTFTHSMEFHTSFDEVRIRVRQ
jgi:RHS repeat-associated protein